MKGELALIQDVGDNRNRIIKRDIDLDEAYSLQKQYEKETGKTWFYIMNIKDL